MTMFLRGTYWVQVLEMNFSSINFDKLFKVASFSSSQVIYDEDASLMMYYTWIYFSE